ncbi:hypothetical protein C1I98_22990 [Spongiactinospora gelatinilytica]|uniref:Uncharacterized protein n=1 Tax=Spongiactinospora gelatinilytica TaxID=2666298 RepID=A0A2W2GIB3_9ACTN|nr:hypothetical protein [Spongiactinospora gelatinilytica]PZG39895.1 hypothetical protein C1I98_22990 [Spongiactinospora gelatinilytica]
MITVELPALDGRQPLGFLAALGLLRVLAQERDIPARLSFSATSATALLHSPLESPEQIAAVLAEVVAGIEAPAVLPGVPAGFPPTAGIGKDPLRWPREDYRACAEQLKETHPRAARLWLPCLTTDLAIDSQGRGAISPFLAPAGKQNSRTFFEKPLQAVQANPGHLLEALVRWRRVEGFTGEYLDHHVLRSAADDSRGRTGQEAGVPGATWLATMALPLFRLAGDGSRVRCTLWHRIAHEHIMIWPLWRPALDLEGVRRLLEHPASRPIDDAPTVSTTAWEPLGVIAAYGARRHRIPGRTFDGVLTPTSLHTR